MQVARKKPQTGFNTLNQLSRSYTKHYSNCWCIKVRSIATNYEIDQKKLINNTRVQCKSQNQLKNKRLMEGAITNEGRGSLGR